MNARALTPLDRFLADTQRALDTVFGAPSAERANPADGVAQIELDDEAKANLQVSVDAVKELLEACKGIDGSLA